MNIYISGSLAYDRIMNFPGKFEDHILPEKIHILNVSFMVESLTEKFGGTAGNIAFTLALLGEKPRVLSPVGRDFEPYRAWMDRNGLPLDGIKVIDRELTAGAYITTDKSDNQITGFNPGAMKYASEYEFDGVDPRQCLGIISPGNLDDMIGYPKEYKRRGIDYIFDPGQQIPVLTGEQMRELISGAAILVSNDYELDMIMKATDWSVDDILEQTPTVITTLGESGSRVITRDGQTEIPPAKADKVVDPTGAGDAYRSGLLKGLVEGKSVVEAARMGSVCGSFAVEAHGTQEHSFTIEEFNARLAGLS